MKKILELIGAVFFWAFYAIFSIFKFIFLGISDAYKSVFDKNDSQSFAFSVELVNQLTQLCENKNNNNISKEAIITEMRDFTFSFARNMGHRDISEIYVEGLINKIYNDTIKK